MRIAVVAHEAVIYGSLSGFTSRYDSVIKALSEDHAVAVIYLEDYPVKFRRHVEETSSIAEVVEIQVPTQPQSRTDRLAHVAHLGLGGLALERWERILIRTLTAWKPDVVVVFAPMRRYPFRSLPPRYPTISFVEEDMSAFPENRRTTQIGRALVYVEGWVERWQLRRSKCVVVIADTELDWARASFPHSQAHVVPHCIDQSYWDGEPLEIPSLGPRSVLVSGSMGALRNAQGLRSIVEELIRLKPAESPEFIVTSSTGLHPLLNDVADRFRFLGQIADLRPYYRAATATLVPSFIVTGAKTTILQGWATHCPVVTTAAAAESVGAYGSGELLAGHSAREVAELLCSVLGDDDLRGRLAERGRQAFVERHSLERVRSSVAAALRDATGGGGRTGATGRGIPLR